MTNLTDEQAIRKGVELAPEWYFEGQHIHCGGLYLGHYELDGFRDKDFQRTCLAALAADLVDAMFSDNCNLRVVTTMPSNEHNFQTTVTHYFGSNDLPIYCGYGETESMSRINAVLAFYEAHPELKP